METDPAFLAAELYSFIGILLSAIIFLRLALKARSIGAFRFQLSIFILIWVAAEVPHILDTIGLIDVSSYLELGLYLHLISMIIFAGFIGLRSLRFIHPHNLKGSDFFTAQPPTTSPTTPGSFNTFEPGDTET